EEFPAPAAEPQSAVEPAEQPDDHVTAAAPVEVAQLPVEEEHVAPEPETVAEADSAISSEEDDAQAEPAHPVEPEQLEQDAVASDEAEHPAAVAFEPQEESEAAAEETAQVPDAV